MIVILKHEARQEQIDRLKQFLLGMGLRIDESKGENSTILGLVGDTTRVDADLISSLDAVEAVSRVQEPYKKANRKFHPQDTMVDCGGVTIGHGLFQIRPLLRGERRADGHGCQGGQSGGRNAAARRRV